MPALPPSTAGALDLTAARAAGAVADANGSAEYKEQLVSVLVRRAILEAIERAS